MVYSLFLLYGRYVNLHIKVQKGLVPLYFPLLFSIVYDMITVRILAGGWSPPFPHLFDGFFLCPQLFTMRFIYAPSIYRLIGLIFPASGCAALEAVPISRNVYTLSISTKVLLPTFTLGIFPSLTSLLSPVWVTAVCSSACFNSMYASLIVRIFAIP